jgi:glutaryl-CoA dehydrogenase (non-decarboxylating)
LDYLALGAASEALGRLDLSYQISLTVHLALVAMTIMQWGSPAQRQRWLPALAAGTEIATFALTEPGAGSDVSALAARAVPDGGGFRLSGEKTWISGATDASLFLVFATTDPDLRHQGITAFIVAKASARLGTPSLHGKLGIRAGNTGSVVLSDVWVPDSDVLGELGEGFPIALSALATGLFTVGFGALGIISACRSLAVDVLRRASAGSSAAIRQLDGQQIAMMAVQEATSRHLLNQAATLKNRGLPSQQETSLAKWTAADGAVAVAEATLTLAQRYQDDSIATIERHLRNAKGAVIYGGTAQIHQVMQGAYATGDRHERPSRRPPLTARHLAGVTELEMESPG